MKSLYLFICMCSYPCGTLRVSREIKFDVTWSYVKRQTAKMTFEFVFFSSNPLLNHTNLEKCLLLFATNTNVFTLLFKELNTEGKRFIFAVCRLTYDHVMSNLISLVCDMTTERFLLALRCMIARRGMCSIIWSDNAKAFRAANMELQRCWRVLETQTT